jgi:hypothetical protein
MNSKMQFLMVLIILLFSKYAYSQNKTDSHLIKIASLQWQPLVYFNNQLFPSSIIGLASYQNQYPDTLFNIIKKPLGFLIEDSLYNDSLKWEIECVDKSYFDKISGYFKVIKSEKPTYFNVDIPWSYKALTNNLNPVPISIYFRLFDGEGNKSEKLVTATVASINDCILYYKKEDLQYLLSTYVQEDDPAIYKILRETLHDKMIDNFISYQPDSNEVDKQVAAIWRTLHERGLSYSNITTSGLSSKNEYKNPVISQKVPTFHDALTTLQANALDGTIVFASILKRIGIDPILVLVPGHCFLGYHVNDNSIHYLETTMLSLNTIYEKGKLVNVLIAAKTPEEKNKAYMKLFHAARMAGQDEFDKYGGQEKVIDINYWRKYILPIPIYN